MKIIGHPARLLIIAAGATVLFTVSAVPAQTSLPIYTDHLVNGFQDWSWAAHNLTNAPPAPVHSGSNSISVSNATAGGGISFHQNDFNSSIYSNLAFWANGGPGGGQRLQVYVSLGASDQAGFNLPAPLPANVWQQFIIPLTALNAANQTNLARITIKLNSGSGTYYLDDIQLNPMPAPLLLHLGVDAGQILRMADARWFGVNTATWDGLLGNAQTLPLLKEMGGLALRWPGGSTSDTYHWASDSAGNGRFMNLATNLNVQTNSFITVNYGSGTSNEAAAWVKSFNLTNHCNFIYWEIGNENYGTWETDNNNLPHDPFTYANFAKNYIALMKAADPTIKIGVVAVPGENTYANNATHFAINPRTGTTNYGWTPVLLNTLKTIGVTPDFLIYHFYPQWTAPPSSGGWQPNSPDSDPWLLQVASNWAQDAADLRQQLTDYLGAPGTNIELVCTENNSDSGAMGRQSTSIVNGLYLADSVSQLMKTEFNSYVWWDCHNGTDTSGDFDPTLYGWRTYGDYGLLNQSNARHPTFYAEKLLQSFVRPGDTILKASSDYLLLSAYAARKADGALAMLVINKAPTNIFSAQISLANFVPWSSTTVRSYGLPQDEATRTNAAASAQDISTNTAPSATIFTNSFPPYSLTLFTFAPVASQLQVVSGSQTQLVFQLQGQAGVPYQIQSSTNLIAWTSNATVTLSGMTGNVTNNLSTGAKFWRAVWLP
ncbi:MAG TPA: hypothetical protein VFC17_07820 [Candidatus Limnocylindrales bacterium]|nr:hypothetical protein [Candidatus Limnocylindrales bacterium]